MQTVRFGKTGLKVSKLCFGTMTLDSSAWKPWALDEAESEPVLKQALDSGFTFFDMADWYSTGENERVVATTLTSMVPRDKLVFTTKAMYAMSDDPMMIARAGGATAAVEYLEKARASNNTSKMGSWHPLNCVDTPDQPQTRVPNLAGNEGGKGSEEEDGHLYGYDTDYGIGGDSWIHSTSMINVGYYVAVAPNNQSANVRNLPFNT